MARVTLRNLSKRFGDVVAVDNLSLEIENGEFVTLLGPSGCGKSTTLYCIAGLEEPSSGDIFFDEKRVTDLDPRDRDVAMVFQDYALYPHMSVYDNLAFALTLQGMKHAAADQQVKYAAELLGIQHLLDRRPAELSGGQRQRVALGRAIVRNPLAFLMDEPLSNLDAALRVNTRTEIKKLQRDLGVTTIFVTHDQEEAMVLSDRIAILRDGTLQQYGPPMTVYRDPANLYVARFIGSPAMNVIEGQLEPAGGGVSFRFDGGSVAIAPAAFTAPLRQGGGAARPALLGIRPENLVLHAPPRPGDPRAEVFLVEPVGPVAYVNLRLGAQVLKASVDPSAPYAVGDTVGLGLERGPVYFFDPASGARL